MSTDQTSNEHLAELHELVPPTTKILLVDDSALQAKTSMKIFREQGYSNISSCQDPFQAVAMIKHENIEIIFCDWNMPGCSGLELFTDLRKDASTRDIPFVLVTSNNQKDQVLQALKSGVTDYIVKPLTPGTLSVQLHKIGVRLKATGAG